MLSTKEKTIILGGLFHDIGKFQQRCENLKIQHPDLGSNFVDSLQDEFLRVLDENQEEFNNLKKIISDHHKKSSDLSIKACRESDHTSASERVEKSESEEAGNIWSHHFLSSIFAKISLLSETKTDLRYYKHQLLDKTAYDILIPQYFSEQDAKFDKYTYANQSNVFQKFSQDTKSVLSFYTSTEDFPTLISLILMVFEKYMWCIPDFTGSDQTDISLFNHLKDVAGISHSLYKNWIEDESNNNLNLVIGDLPGIQNYIFNIINKKPAKILRGRSIFVQILTRRFASMFIEKLGLTEANLIMFAGGKFYILAHSTKDFSKKYSEILNEIDEYLINNFKYEMKFASGIATFDINDLKERKITFGQIIDQASYNLLNGRHQLFSTHLFNKDSFDEHKFVLSEDPYMDTSNSDSNKIKCAVTDKPIFKNRKKELPDLGEDIFVDQQVWIEYEIGKNIPYGTVVIEMTNDLSNVIKIQKLDNFKLGNQNNNLKFILNPDLKNLIEYSQNKKDLLKNSQFIEVANYCSTEEKYVLEFESIAQKSIGANYLSLIKGDIDNLGLIMSSGLVGQDDTENVKNRNDFTSISRTTTLSNHLKYFFSFCLNAFLKEWDSSNKKNSTINSGSSDQLVYTVFAGGDDLMLIAPQSSALKLVKDLNANFKDFVCKNNEIHISYSLTNFKHNTPIKLVASLADYNQDLVKSKLKNLSFYSSIDEMLNNNGSFKSDQDKSGVNIFNTVLNSEDIEKILLNKNKLISWVQEKNNPINSSIIFNMLSLSELMICYHEKNDTSKLLWHPYLTRMINRLIKDDRGRYTHPELGLFFDEALDISNYGKGKSEFHKMLYPVICSTILELRNK